MSHVGRLLQLLLAVAVVLPPAAGAQPATPEYTIKDDRPRTGSHLRRDAIKGFGIAVNLSYAELPPADRQRLHSIYERMGEGDEPPFPLAGLTSIYEPLRKVQDKLRERGELSLVATVDSTGQVQEVKVFESPSARMAAFAAQVLTLTKFKPAKCGGVPCVMEFPVWLTLGIGR